VAALWCVGLWGGEGMKGASDRTGGGRWRLAFLGYRGRSGLGWPAEQPPAGRQIGRRDVRWEGSGMTGDLGGFV
jgi:hypothetical protein